MERRGNAAPTYEGREAQPGQQADAQLHAVINSAIGVGQLELIRLLDERLRQLVPQLVQQSLSNNGFLQNNVPQQNQQLSNNQQISANDSIQPPAGTVQHPTTGPSRATPVQTPHQHVSNPWPPMTQTMAPPAPPLQDTMEYAPNGIPQATHVRNYLPAPNTAGPTNFVPPSQQAYGYPQAASQPHTAMSHTPVRKMEVEKWRLKFDGTSKSIGAEDFMFRLEQMRLDYQCEWEEVLVKFPQLLEGPAEEWYWMQRRLGRVQSFPELKEAFLSQFRKYESDFDVQRKMMDKRQGPLESFEEFCNGMVRLRNQQREPMSEQMLVDIMKTNLKPAMAALVFPIRMFGLQHFREECRKAELLLANQRQAAQAHRQQFTPRVHELEYEEAPLELEVDAINRQSKYVCWNCREHGHGFMECPSTTRNLFCYGCGLENVVKPNCPRCKGNRQAGTAKGETRPAYQNPP